MSELDIDIGRQRRLKGIVKDLHEGSDVKKVKKSFAKLIKDVSPQEIAAMEQSLIADGVPVQQVQQICDVHVQVFQDALGKQKKSKSLPGHPVHTYMLENKEALKIVRNVKRLLKGNEAKSVIHELEKELKRLGDLELHYSRKENQLFPFLESVGFTGPSKVMWGKHDEIRQILKTVRESVSEAAAGENWSELKARGKTLLRSIKRMIFMEERILFPTALGKLSDKHWIEIRRGEAEIGYAWIKPGNLWDPTVLSVGEPEPESQPKDQLSIPLDVGKLRGDQLNLLLKHLPFDVTFVDENDQVQYYTDGDEKIFPRSPGIIGRDVKNCHPPKSVDIVEKLLTDFRNKEREVGEFWLNVKDRLVYIRYLPVYDEAGTYRGVIEVSQDVSEIIKLEGERRLLDE